MVNLFIILHKKVIDFSVGKWSALIKQAKKKQEEQNKNLLHTIQCDESTAKEKISAKDGKYHTLKYVFDTTVVYFDHLIKLDVHIFQKIPLSERVEKTQFIYYLS